MQPILAAFVLLAALAFSGCGDPPADPPAEPAESSSSSSSPPPAATTSSSSRPPSSSTSSSATSSSTSTGTSSASSTTGSSNGTETGSAAAKPTPVTVTCDLSGNGNLFEGPTATYRCATPDIVSDNGAAFTAIHVSATFETTPTTPAGGTTLTITNQQGEDLGSASGDSPLEFDLDVVPSAASFYLVAHLTVFVAPQVGPAMTATGTISFAAS
jgi:hypothetical protein